MRELLWWIELIAYKTQPLVKEWDRPFENGVTKIAGWQINVMVKIVGGVHHLSQKDTRLETFD